MTLISRPEGRTPHFPPIAPAFHVLRALGRSLVILAALAPTTAFARGGALQWGYYNQAQGYPIWNLWLMTNPWSQMSGWAIPHHNLGPPGLNQVDGTFPGPQFPSPYGNTWRTEPFDRTKAFTGSASQGLNTAAASRTAASLTGPTASPPAPVTTASFRVDRTLEPPYYRNYNAYWRNGYWGGGLRGWIAWGGGLSERAFPRWSIGPLYYASGYGVYVNPFVDAAGSQPPPHLDYRQPVYDDEALESAASAGRVLGADGDARAALDETRRFLVKSPLVTAGLRALDEAREAFRNKDYDLALRKSDEAIRKAPGDAGWHEFRALALFARGDYRQAAATIYGVLAVAPGWDWTTLSGMYSDPDELTKHLRQLESYRKQHPNAADASFLLAYHYTTCRHADAAVRQLRNVVRLLPADNLAPPLLTLISGAGEKGPPLSPSADVATPAAAALEPEKLVGQWTAGRTGTAIELTFKPDQEFTWSVQAGTRSRPLEGTYTLDGDRLTLRSSLGQLPGRAIPTDSGGFRFTLSENDPTDHGLEFSSSK